MPAVPSPSPTPPGSGLIVHDILHSAAHGFWLAATSSPWLDALFALILITGLVRFVRAMIHGGHGRDPVRRFTTADKTLLLARAGHRCEHHGLLTGRCRQTERLQADHVHPHSRGGATALANGQALCPHHNQTKSATVPWDWQLNRLARRRAGYYPAGSTGTVMRHHPRRPRRSEPVRGPS
jgi:hypothetical protein